MSLLCAKTPGTRGDRRAARGRRKRNALMRMPLSLGCAQHEPREGPRQGASIRYLARRHDRPRGPPPDFTLSSHRSTSPLSNRTYRPSLTCGIRPARASRKGHFAGTPRRTASSSAVKRRSLTAAPPSATTPPDHDTYPSSNARHASPARTSGRTRRARTPAQAPAPNAATRDTRERPPGALHATASRTPTRSPCTTNARRHASADSAETTPPGASADTTSTNARNHPRDATP
jgi:hypothetical protein